ncbi:hypothetical protein ABT352_04050 [Streptosporangium sp. NPDC000563]|uniref:hypothetical protein n=1 Tax=Streptosporangium sp. NPDC000563 TaxID=3154366 RepID=UPI00332A981E
MPIRNNVRIAWLVAGGALTALAVAFTTIGAWAEITAPRRTTETTARSWALTAPGIVVESASHVNISVAPGAVKRLDLERMLSWAGDRPVVTEEWDGRTLRLDVRCPGVDRPGDPACQADYILRVPAATDVEVKSRRFGTLMASDIDGDLRLSTTVGDVIVDGTKGDLWARTRTGNVIGIDLGSTKADVETGTGDVDLGFTVPPGDVGAVARTTGDVRVRVPDGEEYREGYDVRTGPGHAVVEVRRDPAAPRRITALTGSGALHIFPF